MAQCLRALATLPENPGSVSNTHILATIDPQLVLRDLKSSSDQAGHCIHTEYLHSCSANTHKIKIIQIIQ